MLFPKAPVFLQQQRAECGLVALAMIAAYFDPDQTANGLRSIAGPSPQGADLRMLIDLAGKIDLVARPVRVNVGELKRLQVPAILHWCMDHFVVLVRVKRRGVLINDPALGQRFVTARELRESFTGVALELSPGPRFGEQKPEQGIRIRDFLMSFQYLGRYLSAMLLLLIVIQILSLAPPVATQLLIDQVVLGQDQVWLFRALGGVAAIMLVVVLLEALRQWTTLFSGTRLAFDSSSTVVRHLFRLPPAFFHNRHPGDVLSKLDSLTPIRRALTQQGINAVVHSVVIASTLAVMFFYSASLAVISIAGLLMSALLRALFVPANRQLNEESLIHGARQNSSLLESLRAYDSVQLLGISSTRLADWQRHFAAATNARARIGQLLIWSTAGTGVINTFEQVFFLGVGIVGITEKQITLGVLFAFMSLRGRLSAAATQLSLIVQDLFLLQTHTNRLSDIVLASPAHQAEARGICRPVDGHLSMTDVSFGYHDSRAVLKSFACDIGVGEHIAVTGPSGCGKSTLLGLLSGQLRPWRGSVCLDNSELDLWRIETLRKSMAIILQNDALFPGSIAENICGFSDSPDMEAMRKAAISAAIWPDIRAMPMMHNTRIGDMQGGLSGGQRQRIILARAFYRRPRIILMDEATSHLDQDTERKVLDAIAAMGATAVSVTHRQDVAQRACRVICM